MFLVVLLVFLWFFVVFGVSWSFLVFFLWSSVNRGGSLRFLVVLGISWWFLVVLGCSWWVRWVICGDLWFFVVSSGFFFICDCWWLLTLPFCS